MRIGFLPSITFLTGPVSKRSFSYDHVVIGAGVVGLAVAAKIAERPKSTNLVIERNSSFGQETSSRNSEGTFKGPFIRTAF
jgi:2-hydroxyglutarate dehydrogenase